MSFQTCNKPVTSTTLVWLSSSHRTSMRYFEECWCKTWHPFDFHCMDTLFVQNLSERAITQNALFQFETFFVDFLKNRKRAFLTFQATVKFCHHNWRTASPFIWVDNGKKAHDVNRNSAQSWFFHFFGTPPKTWGAAGSKNARHPARISSAQNTPCKLKAIQKRCV